MEAIPVYPPAVAPTDRADTPSWLTHRWQRACFIVAIFLFSRGLLLVTGHVAWNHLPKQPLADGQLPPAHDSVFQLFDRNDSYWYRDVIERGYYYDVDPPTHWVESNIGFYPVYPFLVRPVRLLVPDTMLAGQLVSDALLLAACFLLWELAMLELRSTRAAAWTVAFALFCPGSAWLSMVFSESAFLLLLLAVVWGCRRQYWIVAAVAGCLLSLTRAIGVVVVVFVALEVWADWRARRREDGAGSAITAAGWAARALALAGPVLGYLSFYVFLYLRFGDWHAQHKMMLCKWPVNASLATPWAAFAREWAPMHPSKRLLIYGLLAGGVALSALSYTALRRLSYPALAFALLTMYVIATVHSPMARYLAVVVPIHLTLGWLAVRFRALGWPLLAASATVMLVFTALMVNGYSIY